jgi:hypothetical protein
VGAILLDKLNGGFCEEQLMKLTPGYSNLTTCNLYFFIPCMMKCKSRTLVCGGKNLSDCHQQIFKESFEISFAKVLYDDDGDDGFDV